MGRGRWWYGGGGTRCRIGGYHRPLRTQQWGATGRDQVIVEAVNELPDHPIHRKPIVMSAQDMPNYGMIHKSWLEIPMPRVMYMGEDSMRIIHSIVPYESHKRTRDAE